MKRNFIIISLSLLILSLHGQPAAAQQSTTAKTVKLSDFDDAMPARCEYRTSMLQGITQDVPADEMITVVGHLGKGDVKPDLNWRRLANVRAYWTEFLPEGYRRKPETILLIQGVRVDGYGSIDFYAGDKLLWVLKVSSNSDVDFGDCYPPDESYIKHRVYNPCSVKGHEIFYPCRDRRVRRKGRR